MTSRKFEWIFFSLSLSWIKSINNNSLWIGPVLFGLINFWFHVIIDLLKSKQQVCEAVRVFFFSLTFRTRQLHNCNDHSFGHARVHIHTEKRCDRTWPSDASFKMFLIFQWVIDYRWSNLSTSFQVCFFYISFCAAFWDYSNRKKKQNKYCIDDHLITFKTYVCMALCKGK